MTWNVFRPKALKTSGTSFFFRTYDGEDERVGEVSVERELHHVPPQPQQLHRLSQTHEDVTTRSRKQQRRGNTGNTHQDFHLQFKINVSDPDWFMLMKPKQRSHIYCHTRVCVCTTGATDPRRIISDVLSLVVWFRSYKHQQQPEEKTVRWTDTWFEVNKINQIYFKIRDARYRKAKRSWWEIF